MKKIISLKILIITFITIVLIIIGLFTTNIIKKTRANSYFESDNYGLYRVGYDVQKYYTENVNLEDILSGKVDTINILCRSVSLLKEKSGMTEYVYFPIIKINNKKTGTTITAEYDSNFFKKTENTSNNTTNYISFTTKKCQTPSQNKIKIKLNIKRDNTTIIKTIAIQPKYTDKSTENWTFTFSPVSGVPTPGIIVKDGNKTLKKDYDYAVVIYPVTNKEKTSIYSYTVDIGPINNYMGHTPGWTFIIGYYPFKEGRINIEWITTTSIPKINSIKTKDAPQKEFNWTFKKGIDYTETYKKISDNMIEYTISSTGIAHYLKGYGHGNSYQGHFGEPLKIYFCLSDKSSRVKWERCSAPPQKEKEKKSTTNNNQNNKEEQQVKEQVKEQIKEEKKVEEIICHSSPKQINIKGETKQQICYKNVNNKYIEQDLKPDEAVTCAQGYKMSYKELENTCINNISVCNIVYAYNCQYIFKPSVNVSGGKANKEKIGTIKIVGNTNGSSKIKGYYISDGTPPETNTEWDKFSDESYTAYITKNIGTYYIWVINEDNTISYPIMIKVY